MTALAEVPVRQTRQEPARATPTALGSAALTVIAGALGVALGVAALSRSFAPVRIGWLIPLSGAVFQLTALGGLFLAVTGGVAVVAGLYLPGYARVGHLPRFSLAVVPMFVVAMLAVPAAASVVTFLFAWESMAVLSLLLVLSEHRRAEVRTAGLHYAVLSQLGFLSILIGLLLPAGHPGAVRDVAFVLTLVGFGSKAGLVPLHAWLPRAHPAAPSPVSALMSAAMVNMGIYGLLRFDLSRPGTSPTWWGLTLLVVGSVSAVFGVLQASVATELKRLLAYSTTENMGLIVTALGASLLLTTSRQPGLARVALIAALIHVVGHATFKSLGFLAAGSVVVATGETDLDRLGGLAERMPWTTPLFAVAAFSATGLPLGAAFPGEWLLVQAMIHSPRHGATAVALAMPVTLGAVALTTGIGVTAMVKAFGVGFLARPRSAGAAAATETPVAMRAGMAVAALGCLTVGLSPGLLGPALRKAADDVTAPHIASPALGVRIGLAGSSVSPLLLAAAVAVAALAVFAAGAIGQRRRPSTVDAPVWACGAQRLTPRMQYTATSFAEPLQRVFYDVLRPDADLEVTHAAESRYLVERLSYRSRISDVIESRLYRPVLHLVAAVARAVRAAHNGSVHTYLLYGGLGLLVVLLAAR
jgi:formate hydrogenlyase subunit 3/multisubunit Na+/H+ antiporter MnhD subunit